MCTGTYCYIQLLYRYLQEATNQQPLQVGKQKELYPNLDEVEKGEEATGDPTTVNSEHEQKALLEQPQIKKNVASKEFSEIVVKFHVAISPKFKFRADKGDRLRISFGQPLSDFDCYMVEMQPCNTSVIASKNGLQYLIGLLILPKKFRGDAIPYKYYVAKAGSDNTYWETVFTENNAWYSYNTRSSKANAYNRCLEVDPQAELHDQFDDIVWDEKGINCEKVIRQDKDGADQLCHVRTLASIAMLSNIGTTYMSEYGIIKAIKDVKAILARHAENGMPTMVGNMKSAFYTIVAPEYNQKAVLKEYFLSLLRSLKQSSPEESLQKAVLLCLLCHEYKGVVNLDTVQMIQVVFRSFKSASRSMESKVAEEFLRSSSQWKTVLKNYLTDVVNKYFELLERAKNPAQQVTDKGVWIHVLPFLVQLSHTKSGKTTRAGNSAPLINAVRWRQQLSRGSYVLEHLDSLLDSGFDKPEPELCQLLIHVLSDLELITLLHTRHDHKIFQDLDLISLLDRYLNYYRKKPISEVNKCLEEKSLSEMKGLLALLERSWKDKTKQEISAIVASWEDRVVKFHSENKNPSLLVFILCEFLAQCSRLAPEVRKTYSLFDACKEKAVIYLEKSDQTINHNFTIWYKLLNQCRSLNEKSFHGMLSKLSEKTRESEIEDVTDCFLRYSCSRDKEVSDIMFRKISEALKKENKGMGAKILGGIKSLFVEKKDNVLDMIQKLITHESFRPKVDADETVLEILESEMLQSILNFVVTSSIRVEQLSEDADDVLVTMAGRTLGFIDDIKDELISIRRWKWLSERDRWHKLQNITSNFMRLKLVENIEIPWENIRKRVDKKVGAFCEDRDTAQGFLNFLKSKQVLLRDEVDIEHQLAQNQDDVLVKDIRDLAGQLGTSQEVLQDIQWIWQHKKNSVVISDCFQKHLKLAQHHSQNDTIKVTWTVALEKVITKSKMECDGLIKALSQSQLTIDEVGQIFHKVWRKSESLLKEELGELESIQGHAKWAQIVFKQIDMLFKLRSIKKSAAIVAEICEILKCTVSEQDRQYLEQVKKSARNSFQEEQLAVISEEFLALGNEFTTWTKEEIECLGAITECKKLVEWVKKNMKDRQEVKVFVDLASISAGESDMEVGKILTFQRALNGYSPLLFDLKTAPALNDILKACRVVFEGLEKDDCLPLALRDSNREITWIKSVSDMHGSVESSSLNTVQHIAECGKFKVSCSMTSRSIQTLQDMISLEHKNKSRVEKLSYDNLTELRSKLMLISVKKECQEAVTEFKTVLNEVEKVAHCLQELVLYGCHLFSQFTLLCYMDKRRPVTMQISFGHKSEFVRYEKEIERGLEELIGFLHQSLDEWKAYVTSVRVKNPCLNFYTTEQLVLLSQSLAHAASKGEALNIHATNLLRYAIPAIKPVHIQELIDLLKIKQVISQVKEESQCKGSQELPENPKDDLQDVILEELVKYYSYDPALVRKCLKTFTNNGQTLDIEKCADWCEDYQDQVYSAGFVDDYSDSDEDDASPDLEEENIINIWHKFIANISNRDAKDFVELEFLAEQIQKFKDKCDVKPNRKLPTYICEGKPNVVICSEEEAHRIALSIYHTDKEKPLPYLSEVLVCNKDTKLEKVELMCRRALEDSSGRIFVIVHAQLLSYEAGVQIEELLTSSQVQNKKYRLVFISSQGANDRSYIATAFDSNIVSNNVNPPTPESLAGYVKQHLSKDPDSAVTRSDPEKCSFRTIVSSKAGNGKTLYVKKLLKRHNQDLKSIQLHGREVDTTKIISKWGTSYQPNKPGIFHLDLAPTVERKEDLLFSLGILGGIEDSKGNLWLRSKEDLYCVEMRAQDVETDVDVGQEASGPADKLVQILPHVICKSPRLTLDIIKKTHEKYQSVMMKENKLMQLMDIDEYNSETFQRPFQYLSLFNDSDAKLEMFVYENYKKKAVSSMPACLEILLKFCPIQDPSWLELHLFARFLNYQFSTTEKSIYCNYQMMKDDLPGIKMFIIRFLIQMSKDFATRSVEVSDESHGDGFSKPEIQQRRQWENSPHPYVFFNEDGATMSFFGLHIHGNDLRAEGKDDEILEQNIITKRLLEGLKNQGVVFNRNFDDQERLREAQEDGEGRSRQFLSDTQTAKTPRAKKLEQLCLVFGIEPHDPDFSYELTYDNVMKMLGIHMRFRCNIPVIIMGETGSGKTRLIKFMCDLKRGKQVESKNMLIMKTHGAITQEDIFRKTRKAISLARENFKKGIKTTVLFFDEANTTKDIGVIKNIMCDRLLNGEKIPDDIGLQFVAAVNPYRKHSSEMIQKLEQAGLGYHIKAELTQDRIGKIPMRQLVYRVAEIPESMFPLIWDFGTLKADPERKYIRQMVLSRRETNGTNNLTEEAVSDDNVEVLLECLTKTQEFMRKQKDECSFVSLRDVERTLEVLAWVHTKRDSIFEALRDLSEHVAKYSDFTIGLCLALGVAYLVRLDNREDYCQTVSELIPELAGQPEHGIGHIVDTCQNFFVNQLRLNEDIAKNDALKENVWIMTICIELKIPLFLVGKPGSSKSLAKTVVADVMQGPQSYSDLFKTFKEVFMVSFQCSPLATSEGILGTFAQCQKFQEKRNLADFTSAVVLDEVGLAEDSDKMPLKTLHPLLETGCIDDQDIFPFHKVAFVGLSNWALDPAKMNRGILVSR